MNLIKDGFSPPWMSPVSRFVIVKRKSTCRRCGNEMLKGAEALEFFGSSDDGGTYNPWKAVTAKVCKPCADMEGWKERR